MRGGARGGSCPPPSHGAGGQTYHFVHPPEILKGRLPPLNKPLVETRQVRKIGAPRLPRGAPQIQGPSQIGLRLHSKIPSAAMVEAYFLSHLLTPAYNLWRAGWLPRSSPQTVQDRELLNLHPPPPSHANRRPADRTDWLTDCRLTDPWWYRNTRSRLPQTASRT